MVQQCACNHRVGADSAWIWFNESGARVGACKSYHTTHRSSQEHATGLSCGAFGIAAAARKIACTLKRSACMHGWVARIAPESKNFLAECSLAMSKCFGRITCPLRTSPGMTQHLSSGGCGRDGLAHPRMASKRPLRLLTYAVVPAEACLLLPGPTRSDASVVRSEPAHCHRNQSRCGLGSSACQPKGRRENKHWARRPCLQMCLLSLVTATSLQAPKPLQVQMTISQNGQLQPGT